MLGLRPYVTTSDDATIADEWNEFVENYENNPFTVRASASALRGFARQLRIDGVEGFGPNQFMQEAKLAFLKIMRESRQIRLKMILSCEMKRRAMDGEVQYLDAYFHTNTIEKIMQLMKAKQYNPLNGSSYIELPKALKGKKAIINMENQDNECFKWCITRVLYPVEKNPQRITKILKEQSDRLDWRGINYPVELDKIKKFEKQNENIVVNVFGYESEARVYPLRISKSPAEKRNQVITLLLIEKDGVANKHYCLINNISRLLSSQVSKQKEPK
ncbi:hypothetical protein AWC38_SpisGene21421 [Stylophora pistillata]|uniref:Uncharacterized protein n=1 Tax=Stylophora pistillata TaxID=50429 RepID=A0A2B4RDJ8_STYPI|nr:hypothetical protein AWC38_SpisGene21421 [Stylophora pistillata]